MLIWVKSDKDGRIELVGLPKGKYILSESFAPLGYALIPEREFTVDGANLVIEALNEKVDFKITKRDKDTFLPIGGADFSMLRKETNERICCIQKAPGQYEYAPKNLDGVYEFMVHPTTGELVIKGLPKGEYTLTETTIPESYVPTNPVTEIQLGDEPVDLTVYNETTSMKIIKYKARNLVQTMSDILTEEERETLRGAVFTVVDKNGTVISGIKKSDGVYVYDDTSSPWATDEFGSATLIELPISTYEEIFLTLGDIVKTLKLVNMHET